MAGTSPQDALAAALYNEGWVLTPGWGADRRRRRDTPNEGFKGDVSKALAALHKQGFDVVPTGPAASLEQPERDGPDEVATPDSPEVAQESRGLDVERLADALRICGWTPAACMDEAEAIAREYAKEVEPPPLDFGQQWGLPRVVAEDVKRHPEKYAKEADR